MTVAILYREELREYDWGPGHPFRGDRYQNFVEFFTKRLEPDSNYQFLKADWGTDEDLLRICNRDYINFTKRYFRAANLGLAEAGDFFQYHSLDNRPIGRPGKVEEAARLVIGQAKLAADLVHSGEYEKVVSVGGGLHHAKASFGEGFCIYNDVAFTAVYLLERYNLKRILVLDTDAHAGNGTADYFYSDPRVLFIDTHQDPKTIYPGSGYVSETGSGEGIGKTINIPLSVNAGNDSFRYVFEHIIEPVTKEFQPEIIIRNGGSDPHFNDGLTSLGLTMDGFRMIGQKVRKMSDICDGKVIDLVASGYRPSVLPYAWTAMISGLANFNIPVEELNPIPSCMRIDTQMPETIKTVSEIKTCLKDYWKCLR